MSKAKKPPEPKRGPGRPPGTNSRTVMLSVKLSLIERDEAVARAERAGLSLADWVRARLRVVGD